MRRSQRNSILLLANNEGLTLVEVMMTLLIFATVLAVINNVFFTTQSLYSSTSQRAAM
jgi:prepilin-type N-terminal cleavage/methylation domain-containing protein